MKGELSKMQNNIKTWVFSPERSASRADTDLKTRRKGSNIPPPCSCSQGINTLRNCASPKGQFSVFQQPTPELTLNELNTDHVQAKSK